MKVSRAAAVMTLFFLDGGCHWIFQYESAPDSGVPRLDLRADQEPPRLAFVSVLAGKPGVEGFADGPSAGALFSGPEEIALDWTDQAVYVAELRNEKIRKIDLERQVVSTYFGRSAGTSCLAYGEGCLTAADCCSAICTNALCVPGTIPHGITLKREGATLEMYVATWLEGILRITDGVRGPPIQRAPPFDYLLGIAVRASPEVEGQPRESGGEVRGRGRPGEARGFGVGRHAQDPPGPRCGSAGPAARSRG